VDIIDDPGASAGQFVYLLSTKVGDSIDFILPDVPAGTYQLALEWKGNANRGIMTLSVNGTQVGAALDQYTPDETFTSTTIGNVTVAADGDLTIRLAVTGKNAASSDFALAADRFVLIKQ
jgi:hypothetical protein